MISVSSSTPYPWPFDGAVDPRRVALLVCGAIGSWAARTPTVADAETDIDRLRFEARRTGIAVVLLAQDDPVPAFVRPAEPSTELRPVTDEETVVVAAGADGFYGSRLDPLLTRDQRTHLLVVGRGFETTVHSTLRRANDRGYECLTVSDACAAIEPDLRGGSISSIEMSGGIFGAVAPTSAVLTSLTPLADTTTTHKEQE